MCFFSGYSAQPPEEALVEPFLTNSVRWDWKTVRNEVCVDCRYIVPDGGALLTVYATLNTKGHLL